MNVIARVAYAGTSFYFGVISAAFLSGSVHLAITKIACTQMDNLLLDLQKITHTNENHIRNCVNLVSQVVQHDCDLADSKLLSTFCLAVVTTTITVALAYKAFSCSRTREEPAE